MKRLHGLLAAAFVGLASLGWWVALDVHHAVGQEPAGLNRGADAAELSTDQKRNALMRWLDEELYYHVLFKPADIDSLRGRIDGMSPTAIDAYYDQTERLREIMKTQEWQTVNRYFGYFRSLDSFFALEQQKELERGAGALAPRAVMRLMNVLVDQYLRMQSEAAASNLQRQSAASTRANFLADQDRMRQVALQQAASRSNRNYFASYAPTSGSRVIRRDQYRVPAPLITSRDMARLVVFRNMWYGW